MRVFGILAVLTMAAAGDIARDSGANWDELDAGTGNTTLRAITQSDEGLVAVGDKGTVLVSQDAGISWETTNTDTAGDRYTLYDVIYVPDEADEEDGTLVAVGTSGRVMVSDDQGETWEKTYPPVGQTKPFGLRAIVAHADLLIAAGSGGAVLRSDDSGVSWEQVFPGNTGGYLAIASDGFRLVAVGLGGAVMTSDDDGETWEVGDTGITKDLWGIVLSGTDFVAVGHNGAIITSEDGEEWEVSEIEAINGVFPFFTDVEVVGDRLVTSGVGPQGMRYSDDDGATWDLATTPGSGTLQDVASTGYGLFAAGNSLAVWLSRPNFEAWAASFGLTGANAAETADPDKDGLDNLTEFALDLDPTKLPSATERAMLPRASIDEGEVAATFTLPERLASGIAAVIETSTTLGTGSWTEYSRKTGSGAWSVPADITETSGPPVATGLVEVRYVLGTTGARRFMRLSFVRVSS